MFLARDSLSAPSDWSDAIEYSQPAVWWGDRNNGGVEKTRADTKYLAGELHLTKNLKPTSASHKSAPSLDSLLSPVKKSFPSHELKSEDEGETEEGGTVEGSASPTANLDSATGERIMELMHDLKRKLGTAFLISTHDPMVAGQAEQKIIMRDGKLQANA